MEEKTILITARNRGFGPISKGETIASLLPNYRIRFVGEGNALEYAKKSSHFAEVYDSKLVSENFKNTLFTSCEFCLSFMEQDYAMLCIQLNVDYFYFDSLFGFWEVNNENIFFLNKLNLDKLTSHEKKLVAHKFSKKSFIQNFYGVKDRFDRLKKHLKHSTLTHPIVSPFNKKTFQRNQFSKKKFIIFNLGGLTSTKQSLETLYYETIKKIALNILQDDTLDIRHILVASGYENGYESIHLKSDKKYEHCFINNNKFLDLINETEIIISSPGLTSILENTSLRKKMLIGFEQHKSHQYNLSTLKNSPYAKNCFSIENYISKDIFDINNLSITYSKILNDEILFAKIYKDFISLLINVPQINYDEIDFDLTKNTVSINDVMTLILNEL